MWWMTSKWRLDRRGWTIALALALGSIALLGLGALIPPIAPVTQGLVVAAIVVGVFLAIRARSGELAEYDLGPPPDLGAQDGPEDGDDVAGRRD